MTTTCQIADVWERGGRWFIRDSDGNRYTTSNQFMASNAALAKQAGTPVQIEAGIGWYRPLRDLTPVREQEIA